MGYAKGPATFLASLVVVIGGLFSALVELVSLLSAEFGVAAVSFVEIVIFIFLGVALSFPSRKLVIIATVISGIVFFSTIADYIRVRIEFGPSILVASSQYLFQFFGMPIVIIALWTRDPERS